MANKTVAIKKGNEKWQLRCGIFPVWIPSRLLRRWQWWPVLWHHTRGRSDLAIISRFIPETISTSLRADLVYKVCFSLFGPGGGWEIYWIGSGGFGAYFCYSCRHPIRTQQTHSHHSTRRRCIRNMCKQLIISTTPCIFKGLHEWVVLRGFCRSSNFHL